MTPGVWSPGKITVDASVALDKFGFPHDLHGKRVIDIGALDGAYSFEFERRGATVLAIDIQDPDRTGFNIARAMRKSSVEYKTMSVYDVTPERTGMFDAVWYWGVYYHLREPWVAFRNIHTVMNDDAVLCFEGAALDNAWEVEPSLRKYEAQIRALADVPVTYFTSGEYAGDMSNWYVPNGACLREWLKASGFKDIRIELNRNASRAGGTARKDPAFANWEYHRY